MPDFSYVIPELHQNVSPRVLETSIRTRRKASFTGLMRLDGAVEILPGPAWQEALDRAIDFVGFLPLSIERMRFMRVVQEVPVPQVERSTLSAEQLTNVIENWVVQHEPGIVHVRGENVNRYDLIAGASIPIMEELSILDGEARFSLNDVSFPKTLPSLNYQVIRYVGVQDHGIWREYEIHRAFTPLFNLLADSCSQHPVPMGVFEVWFAVSHTAAPKQGMEFKLEKPGEIITVRFCFGV